MSQSNPVAGGRVGRDPDGPAIIGGAAIGSRTGMTTGSGFKVAAEDPRIHLRPTQFR